jgi:hypothetical protein
MCLVGPERNDLLGLLPWFRTLIFLAYFPYFEKQKAGLCDHHAVCVSVYQPLTTFK